MSRAVIYARFSTDLQQERSIQDQIELCRSFAQRENLEVVRVYEDAARSGASIIGREGMIRLLSDGSNGLFDIVIVEALDRMSRDMEDLAGIHKRLSFGGVKILAVHEGEVNTVLVGLRGLVGQLFREDNAHKVRRGLIGRVKEGLSAGGNAYGYRPDPAAKGKMLVVEEEAEVIRSIFKEFADGKSPRQIAYDLNDTGVRPPRGSRWNASTINGSVQRGNGILHNSLYIGELVWNRVRMIKDPETGKRVSRPNPIDQWTTVKTPSLAIVSQDLWEAAQSPRRAAFGRTAGSQKRPKRLLSGLLECKACGAGMSTMGTDRSGRVRIRCSAAHESKTCPDPKTFYLDEVERVVLDALFCSPSDCKAMLQAFEKRQQRKSQPTESSTQTSEKLTAEIKRRQTEIRRLVDAVAQGFLKATDARQRIDLATRARDLAENQLKDMSANTRDRACLETRDLREIFEKGSPSDRAIVFRILRSLFRRVVISRGAHPRLKIDIRRHSL